MNRRSRHLVVLMVAVVTATIASFAVYAGDAQACPHAPTQRDSRSSWRHARWLSAPSSPSSRREGPVRGPPAAPCPAPSATSRTPSSRGLLTAVLENEPITANKLASMDAGAGLPPAIPRGMRAMSVKVNDVIGVAGFVVPDTRVDVVVTIRRTNDSMTRTAASNVQVLAAGTRQDQGKPESDAKTPQRLDGRDADGVSRGRRAHRARAGGRRDHARAAQPARHRAADDDRRQDGVAPRRRRDAGTAPAPASRERARRQPRASCRAPQASREVEPPRRSARDDQGRSHPRREARPMKRSFS